MINELDNLVSNVEEFYLQLENVVLVAKDYKFEIDICEELLDDFYTEGWEFNYAQDDSFYNKGDRMIEIENLFQKFPDSNTQIKYRDLKSKIWRIIPDFYLCHKGEYQYVEPPENYKIDKPYNE